MRSCKRVVLLPGRSAGSVESAEKEVESMTGAELTAWIQEHEAEEMEVLCINFDGLISHAHKVDVAEDAATHEKKLVIT